jgi:hypothetical protein
MNINRYDLYVERDSMKGNILVAKIANNPKGRLVSYEEYKSLKDKYDELKFRMDSLEK